MVRIEMLPAARGDAIWIEYGSEAKPHRILIDGGPVNAYPANRAGRINAQLVHLYHTVARTPGAKLWSPPESDLIEARVNPKVQVWVHVDYHGYRKAYQHFGMPPLPPGYFSDHVQNREAVRLCGHYHPYLRLCSVSHGVNTSGGGVHGGDGIEKEVVRNLADFPSWFHELFRQAIEIAWVLWLFRTLCGIEDGRG